SSNNNNGDLFNKIFVAEDNNDENINKSNSTKILGILKKEIQVEPHIINIINIFKEYKANRNNNCNDKLSKIDIIDLSPKSKFVKQILLEPYKKFIESSENYDKLIPDKTHKFLVNFFSQELTQQQWTEAIYNLNIKDYNEDITKIAIKLITKTIDNFLQAFSLGHMNSLHNKETLEHPFLNDYIHPCLKAALWNCTNWGNIITKPIKRQKGDGIEFANNFKKYQIVYIEGTRPYKVDQKKIINTQNKLGKNLKSLFLEIIKERVATRQIIMPNMEVFGVTSVECSIYMYVFGFSEIDDASIPRDYTEVEEFIYFYEAILKWVVNV
ncbi:32199_t:CDS:2, partial [Gigaspora margarita]